MKAANDVAAHVAPFGPLPPPSPAPVSPAPAPMDSHLLGTTLGVTVAFQLACFAGAFLLQIDTLTDLAGSLNFIALALLSYFAGGAPARGDARALALTALVCVSRAELGAFLLYRVLRRGKDARFDPIRASAGAFLAFWCFQMLWVWGVSLPVVFVNAGGGRAGALTAGDWAGLAVAAAGLLLQAVADVQKDAFRADAANAARWCDAGVWAWSRHPNFFGEMLIWWGAFGLAAGAFAAEPAGWATVASPLLTMLILLLGSGMPTAEGDNQRRWMKTPEQAAAFAAYRARTSPLVPLPPALYAALPRALTRWVLFEWDRFEVSAPESARLNPAEGAAARSS